MGFSRQEYWSVLPFPFPLDHILWELFIMTHPSWVAQHGMVHSFNELCKPLHRDKAVIHEEGCDLCSNSKWEPNLKVEDGAYIQFSSVQFSRSVVSNSLQPPWISACQASLSITNSRSLLKLMSIELVMPSSHLILCRPLLLLPPIPPSIRAFFSESTLCMRWPK